MKRAIGIGGVFFKAKNPKELAAWYEKHLGIAFNGETHAIFQFQPKEKGHAVLSTFEADSKYFEPSASPFMVNLRVENLLELLAVLREEGVQVLDETEDGDYGKFGWILDPEGNKVELWEPPD
jgi:predicted enzyme related to lactoylglutathione lyase